MCQSSLKCLLLSLFVALLVVAPASSTSTSAKHKSSHREHQRHHQHMEKHHMPKTKAEGGGGVLNDKDLLRDKEHLQEDLQGELTKEQIDSMSEKELEYYYFKVHDFDKDNKLDGLELLAALGHVVQHGDGDEGLDLMHLPMVEEMIDQVFRDSDRNQDGFLTYSEYALGRYHMKE